ncbi:MAG TPA: DUF1624 domain-containing protein [Bacteroidetes bacterium]|nr:DUF1624 domain-containing protein [Bacteroidota bacterium]
MNIRWKKKKKLNSERFVEIDIIRGLAILLMVLGHFLWDLDYFNVLPINRGVYSALQAFVPQTFFLIVGIGVIISYKRRKLTPKNEKKYFKYLIFRGLKVLGLGVLLTFLSLIFIPKTPIFFGVLHCIGLSIVMCVPFIMFKRYSFIFAVFFILIGCLFSQMLVTNPTMLHLVVGLYPANIWSFTVDYFPIFPWFGIVILGISIGDFLYCGNKRRFSFPDVGKCKPAKLISWIGQHSLGIYLVHQPAIAGFMYLFLRTH